MAAISPEVAQQEIEKWLDHKRVSEKRRESLSDQIEILVNAVVEGELVLDEKFTLKQKLRFPIENEITTTALEYKPRLKIGEVHNRLQGIKPGDADGRITAYISALTGKPKEVIKNLEVDDYGIGQSIAIFFIQ